MDEVDVDVETLDSVRVEVDVDNVLLVEVMVVELLDVDVFVLTVVLLLADVVVELEMLVDVKVVVVEVSGSGTLQKYRRFDWQFASFHCIVLPRPRVCVEMHVAVSTNPLPSGTKFGSPFAQSWWTGC